MSDLTLVDLRRPRTVDDSLPTGPQIEKCIQALGWNQTKLADFVTRFGFPVTQQEISLLIKGGESVPTKPGFKEVRRKAKDPHWMTGLNDSGISYRARIRLFLYRKGFLFPDSKTVFRCDPDLFDFWVKDAASQAGFESNFDGSNSEYDEERLWKNVRHNAERIYPDLHSLASKSAQELREILDGALDEFSDTDLEKLEALMTEKQ